MKYFIKILPTEGKMKEGDKFFQQGKLLTSGSGKQRIAGGGDRKLAKFFLCSRDIQVGDTLRSKHGFDEIVKEILDSEYVKTDLSHKEHISNLTKVIGEVSPDALSFVNEGDEFEENQWRGPIIDRSEFKAKYFIQIMDSQGNFH